MLYRKSMVVKNLILSIIILISAHMRLWKRKLCADKTLEQSIIVCAHPDDEVLWFSSILAEVDKIVICYLGVESNTECTEGRKQALAQYPLRKVSCLGIGQAAVFRQANWQNPLFGDSGIMIPESNASSEKYRENFIEIKRLLREKLNGYKNVFTHNPWGEYGHEEHVQVYLAVKELQKEMKFNLWFTNYCSDVSFNLMIKSLSKCHCKYITRKPDKIMSWYLERLYCNCGCWTWFNQWKLFKQESFINGNLQNDNHNIIGHVFPLNIVKRKN